MTRTLTTVRPVRAQAGTIATLLRRIAHALRIKVDAERLDAMPRDRLLDMGMAPRTEANQRTSGQTGPIPRAPLW